MSASIALLAEGTRQRAEAWLGALRGLGIHAQVTSTRRSRAEQQRLFDKFQRGESDLPAAEPGTSAHEFGLALDVVFESEDDLADAITLGEESGFVWAGAGDPVHFEDVLTEAPTLGEIQEAGGFPEFETTGAAKVLASTRALGERIIGAFGVDVSDLFGDPRQKRCRC